MNNSQPQAFHKIKNQTEQRVEMINFFYHHFVMDFSLQQTEKFFLKKKNFNHYQQEVLDFIFQTFDQLLNIIKKNLSDDGTFSEISHLEKAILLVIIAEHYMKQVDKSILIAEAIKLTKRYSNFVAYRYIHKLLDQVFQTYTIKDFLFHNKEE